MPSYAYVHMGSESGTPLTLLVYIDEPYDVVNVDLGPFVRVRKSVQPASTSYDARTYTLDDRTISNTTSGEAAAGA